MPGAKTGCTFSTLTFDAPKYVNYLLGRFLSRGGSVVRGKVGHVNQIIEGGVDLFARGQASTSPVDAVVVCAGLGARTLGGVEDKDVYPVRGQVLFLKAPWVRFGRTASHSEDGLWTYVIPRRNGEVRRYSRRDFASLIARSGRYRRDEVRRRLVRFPPLAARSGWVLRNTFQVSGWTPRDH